MEGGFQAGVVANVFAEAYQRDEIARTLLPQDAPAHLAPVAVAADGNCLFHATSLLATGDQMAAHDVLRRLTAQELEENVHAYTDLCLQRAETCERKGRSFSAKHLLGLVLDPSSDSIYCRMLEQGASSTLAFRKALENVAQRSRKNGTYASLAEICALANVMQVNIRMVYPDKDTSAYRHLLDGTFRPFGPDVKKPITVMWSCSSRKQAVERPVRTNHFVPLLPMKSQLAGPGSTRKPRYPDCDSSSSSNCDSSSSSNSDSDSTGAEKEREHYRSVRKRRAQVLTETSSSDTCNKQGDPSEQKKKATWGRPPQKKHAQFKGRSRSTKHLQTNTLDAFCVKKERTTPASKQKETTEDSHSTKLKTASNTVTSRKPLKLSSQDFKEECKDKTPTVSGKHRMSGFDEVWRSSFPWVRTEADSSGRVTGMFCHLCQKHTCRPAKCSVGKAAWVDIPCVNFTKAGLERHSGSGSHSLAVQSEAQLALSRETGGIAEHIGHIMSVERRSMIAQLKALYWLCKERIPHHFESLLGLVKSLGAEYVDAVCKGQNAKYVSEEFMDEAIAALAHISFFTCWAGPCGKFNIIN